MNTCEDYAALLNAFLDGECSPAEEETVRAHLETCPACAAWLREEQAIRSAYPELEDTPVPEGFADSVLAALPKRKSTRFIQFRTLAVLAACLLLVVLVRTTLPNRLETSSSGAADARSADTAVSISSAEIPRSMEAAGTDSEEPEETEGAKEAKETEDTEEMDTVSEEVAAAEAAGRSEDAQTDEPAQPAEPTETGGTENASAAQAQESSESSKDITTTEKSAGDDGYGGGDGDAGSTDLTAPHTYSNRIDSTMGVVPAAGDTPVPSPESDESDESAVETDENTLETSTALPDTPMGAALESGSTMITGSSPGAESAAAVETEPESESQVASAEAELCYARLTLTAAEVGEVPEGWVLEKAGTEKTVYRLTRPQFDVLLDRLDPAPAVNILQESGTYILLTVSAG